MSVVARPSTELEDLGKVTLLSGSADISCIFFAGGSSALPEVEGQVLNRHVQVKMSPRPPSVGGARPASKGWGLGLAQTDGQAPVQGPVRVAVWWDLSASSMTAAPTRARTRVEGQALWQRAVAPPLTRLGSDRCLGCGQL